MSQELAVSAASLTMILGVVSPMSLASVSSPAVSKPRPEPVAAAVTAADRATGSDVDAPAREPAESYDRRQAVPRTENLYAVAHERAYNGLPTVGGDAVVPADGDGTVRSPQSAPTATAWISVPATGTVATRQAAATSGPRPAKVKKADAPVLLVRVENDHPVLVREPRRRAGRKWAYPACCTSSSTRRPVVASETGC